MNRSQVNHFLVIFKKCNKGTDTGLICYCCITDFRTLLAEDDSPSPAQLLWFRSPARSSGSSASGSLVELQPRCQPGLRSYLRPDLTKLCIQAHMVVGRVRFFCWLQFGVLSSLPHGSLCFGGSLRQIQQGRECPSNRELTRLSDIIPEGMSHHLYHSLWLEVSHRSFHTWRGIT